MLFRDCDVKIMKGDFVGDVVRAEDVQAEAVDWLWRDRIPRGMLTILAARPDEGKGLACAHIASEISRTRYRDPVTGVERWGQVLYSAVEDSPKLMTRPRLEAARANLNSVHLGRFRLPLQLDELAQILITHTIDLLIIDPLASHLTNGVSRHADSIRRVSDPLAEIIEETNTGVIIVEHVLKRVSENSHPLSAIGGNSSGIVAAARMAFLFGSDPADNDRKIMACVKHNIREKPAEISFEVDTHEVEPVGDVPFLMFDEETVFDPMRFLTVKRNGKMGRPADKLAAATEWLANFLYDRYVEGVKEVPAGEVFENGLHVAFSNKILREASRKLDIEKNPPTGRSTKWALPDDLIAEMSKRNGVGNGVKPAADVAPLSADDLPGITDADLQALLGGAPVGDDDGDEDE